jgi:hypothetical protein
MRKMAAVSASILLGSLVVVVATGSPAHANWVKKVIKQQQRAEAKAAGNNAANKPQAAPERTAPRPQKQIVQKTAPTEKKVVAETKEKQPPAKRTDGAYVAQAAGAPQVPTDTQQMMAKQ